MQHFSMNIHKNTEHSRIFCNVPLQNSKSEIRKKLKPTLYLQKSLLASIFNGIVPLESNNKFSYKTPMVKQAN